VCDESVEPASGSESEQNHMTFTNIEVTLHQCATDTEDQPHSPPSTDTDNSHVKNVDLEEAFGMLYSCGDPQLYLFILLYYMTNYMTVRGGQVVRCRTCDRDVVGSNPANGSFVPTPTQRAIPPGSVNEYQKKAGE